MLFAGLQYLSSCITCTDAMQTPAVFLCLLMLPSTISAFHAPMACKCRSKIILGFQRRPGSNQSKLEWQGNATDYDNSRDQAASNEAALPSDDDAAMAAADNVNWDLL